MEEEYAFNNWDLQAVVRGCRSSPTPPPLGPTLSDPLSSLLLTTQPVLKLEISRDNTKWRFPDLMAMPSGLQELEELRKSFFPKSPLGSGASVSETLVVGSTSQPWLLLPPPLLVQKSKASRPLTQTPRSKRRKNKQKKVVCHVPADGGSSDMWAWRKYGQKPIKGSPYPRGYYRCSSSKGCLARKQVERSRTDSGMLIITYTAEHNHPVPTHRNSLAGSTRQKFSGAGTSITTSVPTGRGVEDGSPVEGLSPNTPLTASLEEDILHDEMENEEEEVGMLLVEDVEMVREDELLILGKEGDEEDTGDVQLKKIGDDFSELLDDPCFNSPWIVNGDGPIREVQASRPDPTQEDPSIQYRLSFFTVCSQGLGLVNISPDDQEQEKGKSISGREQQANKQEDEKATQSTKPKSKEKKKMVKLDEWWDSSSDTDSQN